MRLPIIRKVDCVRFYVSNLESGIKFYQDTLGHKLKWRTDDSAGFQMLESDTEIVVQTSQKEQETDLLVESVESSVKYLADAGSTVIVQPFDIQVGKCAVVADPWGNHLTLLDLSKGVLVTNSKNIVIGNKKPL